MIEYNNPDKPEENTLDNLLEGFQLISFDWRYLYVNKATVKQSKYPSKEHLLGSTMMEKYPGIENTELFRDLQECMTERVSKNIINKFTYPDNSFGWFELRIEPVPKGIFILSMDITSRVIAEQEKIAYNDGLEEMIFMTSHRVRQPVTQILGILNLLEGTNQSQDDLKKIASYMKQSAIALDTFTKELTVFIHDMKLKAKVQNQNI